MQYDSFPLTKRRQNKLGNLRCHAGHPLLPWLITLTYHHMLVTYWSEDYVTGCRSSAPAVPGDVLPETICRHPLFPGMCCLRWSVGIRCCWWRTAWDDWIFFMRYCRVPTISQGVQLLPTMYCLRRSADICYCHDVLLEMTGYLSRTDAEFSRSVREWSYFRRWDVSPQWLLPATWWERSRNHTISLSSKNVTPRSMRSEYGGPEGGIPRDFFFYM
jgi:hypothetical protein